MKILKNKYLQFGFEAMLIAILGYVLAQFLPNLPWWNIVVIAGIVSFSLNTKVKSFWTGFTGVALLWGIMAFQLNGSNMNVLATKVGEMLSENGAINSTRLIYITGILGGILGGLGAMTGSYARKMFKKENLEEIKQLDATIS